jgi:hypothetical protein
MSELTIIRTYPGEANYELFEALQKKIYPLGSQRFVLGHDPVTQFLEGCYVLMKGNVPIGRFAFYENSQLFYKNETACTVGSFECLNDIECSDFLLNFAIKLGQEKGYKHLIGPMEGSTWNNYRFSHNNQTPNFFMEPFHHDYYPNMFENAGFKSIAQYISNIDTDLTFDESQIKAFESTYKKKGANFRKLDMDNLETELYKIAQFSNKAFKENFLFTPIQGKDFVEKYSALKTFFDPELIWIVEDENLEIHALSFNIKDHLNKEDDTLIVKTLARRKDSKFNGIGGYLGQKTYQLAKEKGYKQLIHALMSQDNSSVVLSEKYNTIPFKSYALYSFTL